MDASFPPSLPAPEMNKHSPLGIASFVLSFVSMLFAYFNGSMVLGQAIILQ
jgi:hypothetical protein